MHMTDILYRKPKDYTQKSTRIDLIQQGIRITYYTEICCISLHKTSEKRKLKKQKLWTKAFWNKLNQGSERHTLKNYKIFKKEIEGGSTNGIIFHALGLEGLIQLK